MSVITNLEVLSEAECFALLAHHSVGRVAFEGAAGFPVVVPVNYIVDVELIAFKTAPGEKLDCVPSQRVSFEVDTFDPETRTGWSVLAQGTGLDITEAAGLRYDALRRRQLSPWMPQGKTSWLAIYVRRISGRRLFSSVDGAS